MSALKAVVVRTGRASYGEVRRTQTWDRLFRAVGGECVDIGFLDARTVRPSIRHTAALKRGELVPEALVWRADHVLRRLQDIKPDVVILQTARAYQPELMDGPWVTILDLVDRLSASYEQRARLSAGLRRAAFTALAAGHARFECAAGRISERVVAAGRADCDHLDATWVPNLIDPSPRPHATRGKPFDVVFFGSLGYRPNVEALEWLAEGRPADAGLRVLVAGHAPSETVRALCASRGWTLVEDYPSNEWLAEQATVALAPLRSTAGIQNKVLEAAALGIPQVVAPAALAGLSEGFPAVVADTPEDFVAATRELVDDVAGRARLASDAWAYTTERYTSDGWVPTLWSLIESHDEPEPNWTSNNARTVPSRG